MAPHVPTARLRPVLCDSAQCKCALCLGLNSQPPLLDQKHARLSRRPAFRTVNTFDAVAKNVSFSEYSCRTAFFCSQFVNNKKTATSFWALDLQMRGAFQVRLRPPPQHQPEAGRDLPEGGEEGARKWPMEDGGHRRGLGDKVLLEIKVRKSEFPLIKTFFPKGSSGAAPC